MKDQQIDRLADAIVMGLQQKIDQEVRAIPTPPQPKPKESGLSRAFMLAMIGGIVVASTLALFNFFAPVLVGTQAAPQVTATALPTLPPRPTTPPYQPPPPAAPQEVAPVVAPAPPAVIVVTPTYATGCHDGVSYIDGVATNGDCSGGGYAPELPTASPEPTATIAPATAVPPDPTYMDALQKQAPHCIRCAP